MTRPVFAFLAACSLFASSPRNPVLPGDHPDPSIIRLGKSYWTVNTSGNATPVFPIHSSTDLQHWKSEGAVFQDRPEWAVSDFWAPELTLDRGHIRVYYAARNRKGRLCVGVAGAGRPQGPYVDSGPLVCQDDGSIDPFFARDTDGKPYLIWKEDGNSQKKPTKILAQQTSEDGLRLLQADQPHELIVNDVLWEGNVVEGPDIFRRGAWFYMFYAGGACCGADCNYAVGVARSKNLLGPWQKDPANPIVAENQQWKCPGHGTVVQEKKGRYDFLYHAYARKTFLDTGREAVLDRVQWTHDGWPTINGGHGTSGGQQ